MIYDLDHARIAGDNRRKNEGDFSVNLDPVDRNVNQFISDICKEEKWSDILNVLNVEFPTPKEITNQNIYGMQNLYQQHPMVSMMPMNFYNSASSNISNPQYYGGSSINKVPSTSIFSNRISASEAFDGRMVPPGSLSRSVSSSPAQNFHRLPPLLHHGQNRSTAEEKQIINTMDPRQPNQWAHQFPQNDQSNGFKIRRINSWVPVQGRPRAAAAEENSIQSCNGLSCNLCGLSTFDAESRKRRYHFEHLSSESYIGTGTLMEVVARACLPADLPPLEQCPDNTDAVANEFKQPPELSFEEKVSDRKEKSSEVEPKVSSGTLMDVITKSHMNSSVGDQVSHDYKPMQYAKLNELLSEKTKKEVAVVHGDGSGSESGNIRLPSATLADSFSESEIKEHLSSFIQHNKEVFESTVSAIGQNRCQLCSKEKLLLAPAPLYCSSCDSRIKQKVKYYRFTDEENTDKQLSICMSCFKGSRGSISLLRGGCISKANLEQAKNDEESGDLWVQCDRFSNWQHRICGLYNNVKDKEGKAEYVCLKCCLREIENGTRIPSQKTVLGAQDLPRTNLSDHIEQRLFRLLKQERQESARLNRIELEKVPEAAGLIVRVVASVDKELEVKQQFRDIFDGQDYPEKITYRSKLILLFQKRGSVDLCLFGMYVQEFGSECDGPNKRCVYISYLDSVKYFQPERITHSGQSLRTFVYHEILIGYLEHCKKRGFASCYIWACPSQEGDDYIFHCHPETQKTPKQDKLRQWYKLMIRKAADDGIVVDCTNLYNQFFTPTKRGNFKISAANLPYFDGDYWSDAAEGISKKLQQEVEEKLGEFHSKSPTKRMLIPDSTRDDLVMQQLGESILRSKENFMIIRLQHMCTSCHEVILSGSRWVCNQCNNIQLCSRCFDAGKCLSKSRMHSCHSGKSTRLSEEVLKDVPLDTKDEDDVIENKFCETRDGFLNKCRTSQYPFNTLGFAKYSSLMILYHFTHNLVFQPKADTCHTHNLTRPSVKVTSEAEIQQPREQNVSAMKRALDALVHASGCKGIGCSDRDCRIIRKLIAHASTCSVKARNGCRACQRAFVILRKHQQMCTDSSCKILYCKDRRRTTAAYPAPRINKIH